MNPAEIEKIAIQLGQAIRGQRKRLALSQEEVADLSGVSINFIRQIESGKATAQFGKVLCVMVAIGLQFNLVPGSKRLVIQVEK